MYKYLAILILLIIGIVGYNIYSNEKEKEEQERARKNRPKVVDFKKDFNEIFFGSKEKPESEKLNKVNTKEIKTLNVKRKTPGVRTLTNRDIEKLNKKSLKSREMITKEDIQKLKDRNPDDFEENVKIEKVKKEKPKKKLSPLEKIIDSAKKSFSEKNDADTEE